MAFTKINAAGIGSTETVTLDGLTVINDGSFGGNVSVGGTLTYEDVTNIDSVGLITARAGVVVGSGITLSKDGDIFATGVTTATSFVGDGSALTGVASTENIRTNTNATFLQNINVSGSTTTGSLVSSGAVSGTTGTFTGDLTISDKIIHSGDTNTTIRFPAADTITAETGGSERLRITSDGKFGFGTASPVSILHLHETGGSGAPIIQFSNGDTGATTGDGFAIGLADNESPFIYNRENTDLRIATNNTERFRIGSSGQLGIGGATYGSSGQVLTSGGASAAPTWATPSAGGITLLASATLSSSGTTAANISFSTTGYEYIYGKLHSLSRSGGANLNDMGIRFNNSSSAVYDFVMQRMDGFGNGSERYTQGADQFYYGMHGVAGYTSGRNQAVFELHLVNDGVRKPFNMKHSGELSGGPIVLTTDGMLDITSSITSLQVITYDTDINGGTLKLYGVK